MDYTSFTCSARDGLKLAARKYGWQNRDPHPVVCLAGITRNASDFHELALYLSSKKGGKRRVIAIDYRGRGQSEYDSNSDNYNLSTEADDTLDILTALGLGEVNMIGSSRGGLICMLLGSMRPGIFKSVILNDIGPVIDATALVRIWRTYDVNRLPVSIEEAASLRERIAGAASPAFSKEEWLKEANRLYRKENSKLVLQFDKKLLDSLRSINLDERLPDMWPEFASLIRFPMMAIRAENSDMLSEDTFGAMQAFNPDMQTLIAKGQNHAPILSVGGLEKDIAAFLKKQG